MSLLILKREVIVLSTYSSPEERLASNQHLRELASLVEVLEGRVVFSRALALRTHHPATFLSTGQVNLLAEDLQGVVCDLIILDEEISPSQQRNLSKQLNRPVIDRTEVILEVFHRRAKTREACIQVNLAREQYALPRLKNRWNHLSKQRGGGLRQKGEGEQQIELDRRMVERRITRLERELQQIRRQRELRRRKRERRSLPLFALVGYTNSGKSTLLNQLTSANVLTEDRVFATLDTTTRRFQLPNRQDVLLIDTVGFMRKLPHALIAAFRSTLEEVLYANFLLHVADATDPDLAQKIEITQRVLGQLQEEDRRKRPSLLLLNKVDQLPSQEKKNELQATYRRALFLSAKKGGGIESLLRKMESLLSFSRKRISVRIPYHAYSWVARILEEGQVLSQSIEENGLYLEAQVSSSLCRQLHPFLIRKKVP